MKGRAWPCQCGRVGGERAVEGSCGERGGKWESGICDNNIRVFAIIIVVNGGVCDKEGGTKRFMECI